MDRERPAVRNACTAAPADVLTDRRHWQSDFGGALRLRRAGEREALLLTLVCAIDMLTTLYWVMTGRAIEANGAWRGPSTIIRSGSSW